MKTPKLSVAFQVLLATLLGVAGLSYWVVTNLCVDNAVDTGRARSVATQMKSTYERKVLQAEPGRPIQLLQVGGCCFGHVRLAAFGITDPSAIAEIEKAARETLHQVDGVKTIEVRFYGRQAQGVLVPSGTQTDLGRLLRKFSVP